MPKLCPKCLITKPDDEFYTRKEANRTGLGGYCKRCHNETTASKITEKRRVLKKEAILSLGGKCSICGFNNSVWALSFHHKNPKLKDITISKLKNKKDIEDEIKKCILVCVNCHMEIHEGFWPNIFKKPIQINNHSTQLRTNRMKQYIEYLGGRCQKCGYNNCNRALSFHHDHDKSTTIGSLTFLPKLEKMKAELDKCILLCANCHSLHHEDELVE